MSTVAGRMEYIVDFNDSAMVAGIPRTHAAFKNLANQATTSHAAVGTAASQSTIGVVMTTAAVRAPHRRKTSVAGDAGYRSCPSRLPPGGWQ